jgi:hypothetical protein
MNIISLLSLLFSLSLEAGPVQVQPVNPGVTPGINPALLDQCIGAKADKSATLGADVDSKSLSSGLFAYDATKRACKMFVADFNVTADANPADNHGVLDFNMFGGTTASLGQANCNGTELHVRTYEKVPGSSAFVLRSSGKYKAVWHDTDMFDTCELQKVSGSNPPSDKPDPAGTEVWRIAVSATHDAKRVPVTASVAFQIIPW